MEPLILLQQTTLPTILKLSSRPIICNTFSYFFASCCSAAAAKPSIPSCTWDGLGVADQGELVVLGPDVDDLIALLAAHADHRERDPLDLKRPAHGAPRDRSLSRGAGSRPRGCVWENMVMRSRGRMEGSDVR